MPMTAFARPLREIRSSVNRETVADDAMAGVVLGVESVPDGLASGLLAGVNPVAGLFGYLYGMLFGAAFTSTRFMTIQATGAMAIIIADVDLAARDDPARALYTLSILTGVIMIVAGVLRAGRLLRFVASSVMVGFITAVGLNIMMGQLDNFTGYASTGSNRIARAFDVLVHPFDLDGPTTLVGVVTIVLIVVLQRTPLGALGLVVAVIGGSGLAAAFNLPGGDGEGIALVRDIAVIPERLPWPVAPVLGDIWALAVPAVSLAFVGLIQGAGVAAGFPNPDGTPSDPSQDFIGQGVGNIGSGLFRGMPVGGSVSASGLVVQAGARTRLAPICAAGVMAVIVLLLGGVVGYVAMPCLAGLLIVVGAGAVKPARIRSTVKTGSVQATAMVVTLVLTMLIDLQYAVLVGVGVSIVLFTVRQSNRLDVRMLDLAEDGRVREADPPDQVGGREVVVLQPNGSLFFAAAQSLEEQLPEVTPETTGSIVILRLRTSESLGSTLAEVIVRYADKLRDADSKLVLVCGRGELVDQLRATRLLQRIGTENVYVGTEWLGETVRAAHADARHWVETHDGAPGSTDEPSP